MPTSLKNSILVVDDDLQICEMLVLTLAMYGYAPDYELDGLSALKRMQQVKTDLVICDLEVPKMDGLAFVEHKRQLPKIRDIPVILMGAKKGSRQKSYVDGVTAYIGKPFELFRLLKLVEIVLAEKVTVMGS